MQYKKERDVILASLSHEPLELQQIFDWVKTTMKLLGNDETELTNYYLSVTLQICVEAGFVHKTENKYELTESGIAILRNSNLITGAIRIANHVAELRKRPLI